MLFLPHIFVSFSCCLFFVLSLLLSMTHLPPISDQNSRFAEDYLINLYILPLKLDVGNKHVLNANEAEKCLPKCYEFPQWKGDGSMQHSTKSKETASSFWTVAPWSKLALFPAQSSLCEVKGSFFVQSFLQNSSSPLAVSGVGNAPQMVPWGLAKLGSEKEGRVSPLSFSLNIIFFFFFTPSQGHRQPQFGFRGWAHPAVTPCSHVWWLQAEPCPVWGPVPATASGGQGTCTTGLLTWEILITAKVLGIESKLLGCHSLLNVQWLQPVHREQLGQELGWNSNHTLPFLQELVCGRSQLLLLPIPHDSLRTDVSVCAQSSCPTGQLYLQHPHRDPAHRRCRIQQKSGVFSPARTMWLWCHISATFYNAVLLSLALWMHDFSFLP